MLRRNEMLLEITERVRNYSNMESYKEDMVYTVSELFDILKLSVDLINYDTDLIHELNSKK